MVKNSSPRTHSQVRLIAGTWRGRKISFTAIPGLRPTPDRVRETLFNWLQFDLVGKRCLDLFAGSGVLGIEAASRGAAEVSLVESHPVAIEQLQQNLATLKADNIEIVTQDATRFLDQKAQQRYDIIFLDPPYQMRVLEACINKIEQNQWLSEQGTLYFESLRQDAAIELSSAWTLTHEKTAGQIRYYLATLSIRSNEKVY